MRGAKDEDREIKVVGEAKVHDKRQARSWRGSWLAGWVVSREDNVHAVIKDATTVNTFSISFCFWRLKAFTLLLYLYLSL